jgi:hypothetical protein
MVAERSAHEFVLRITELGLQRRTGHWPSWDSLALLERHGQGERDRARSIRLDFVRARAVRTLWDADHLVALEEGGTSALENVQTLCWVCHKAKTREHAARRAARRRGIQAAVG